ncbi:MAG: helix-turn-helix transcriptional regulator [Oscillospiraceae bacterium]|nr:helix-turn-helix transcriptional regulator [Oscillospiraceae bacterium]
MRYEVLKYNRIRDLRNDKKFSQMLVAQYLNIAQNTLSQYELGERNIPNDVLVRLAMFYDTSIDYLLGLTDEPVPYPRKRIK